MEAPKKGNNDDSDDDDVTPLVAATTPTPKGIRATVSSSFPFERIEEENDTKHTAIRNKVLPKQQQSRLRYIVICVILSMLLLLYSKRKTTTINVTTTTNTVTVDENQGTAITSKPYRDKSLYKPKMTLESLRILKEKFSQAYGNFTQQLQTQYGAYYEGIFFTDDQNGNKVTRGSLLFESGNTTSNLSKERFQRKLMMKLLEASAYTYTEEEATTPSTKVTSFRDTKFVWATGGHSATAGHGNFFNESYTAYIQYALEGIFRSVDIELITRKYAMGGTAAAPELALCTKEIYGTDIDVLVWDFGMTDGKSFWKQAWYHYRANLLPYQNPIHIAYHAGAQNWKRYTIADTFEQMGMTSLVSNEDILTQAEGAIPDSFGLSDQQINALPDYVRNYKCGNEIEAGLPYCKSNKFRLGLCPERKFQTSWHPGWKWHALTGYLASFYVIDVMNNAMEELATQLITTDAVTLYHLLQGQVHQDFEEFQRAKTPEILNVFANFNYTDFNSTYIFGGPNYCHTTKLPAQIRYLGILTETRTQIGSTEYDKGIDVQTLVQTKYKSYKTHSANRSTAQPMMLSYDKADRQNCPVPTNEDYKDFFYIGANTGWQQLTLPNRFEQNAYSTGDEKPLLQGYVAMCLTLCPWNKCPKGVWGRNAYTEYQFLDISINDVMVTNFTSLDECDMLRNHDGYRFPVNKEENTVTIAVRLNVPDNLNPNSYMRISSWIVW
jgi:hypothetical protein